VGRIHPRHRPYLPCTRRAIFVATPPLFRGGLSSPRDLEVKLNRLFPNAGIFLEKPVATGTPWENSVGRCEGGGEDIGDAAQGDSLGWVSRTSIGMDITDGDDQVCVAVSQSGDGDEEDHRGEQPNSVSVPFET